jgi:UDP-glucuronate decarboxylase
LELAQKVLAKLPGTSSRVVFKPLPGDDPKMRRPDITLAKELLGWEPVIQLDEGLDRTIAYFQSIC